MEAAQFAYTASGARARVCLHHTSVCRTATQLVHVASGGANRHRIE